MPRTRKVPVPRPWSLLRWGLQFALPLAVGVLLLGGVVILGRVARDSLRERGASLGFAAIEVEPPEGVTREAFLGEVQYLASLPDTFDLYDPALMARLAEAFARHPWVREVERVEKGPGGLRVQLRYREPALRVVVRDGPPEGERERVVDEEGVLLPASARGGQLPRLVGVVTAGLGRPGVAAAEGRVRSAARVAGVFSRHRQELPFEQCAIEVAGDEVVLRGRGWRVQWGRAPGEEREDEPGAEEKVRRLAESGVEGREVDVRKRAP